LSFASLEPACASVQVGPRKGATTTPVVADATAFPTIFTSNTGKVIANKVHIVLQDASIGHLSRFNSGCIRHCALATLEPTSSAVMVGPTEGVTSQPRATDGTATTSIVTWMIGNIISLIVNAVRN
jgi:hypothetical protein